MFRYWSSGRHLCTTVHRVSRFRPNSTNAPSLLGQMVTTTHCPRCGSLGKIPDPLQCRGEGRYRDSMSYETSPCRSRYRLNPSPHRSRSSWPQGRNKRGPICPSKSGRFGAIHSRRNTLYAELRITMLQAALGHESTSKPWINQLSLLYRRELNQAKSSGYVTMGFLD